MPTGDLINNKITDKITSVSKTYSAENSKKSYSDDEIEALKKRYIYPEERQQINDELRLVQQYNYGISKK